MIAIIRHIPSVCKKQGTMACLHCGTPEYAAMAVEWGFDLTTVSGDTRLLAAAASVGRWRDLVEGVRGPAGGGSGY